MIVSLLGIQAGKLLVTRLADFIHVDHGDQVGLACLRLRAVWPVLGDARVNLCAGYQELCTAPW